MTRLTGTDPRESSAPPTLSVIVPAYNSTAYLQKCLTALSASEYDDFEVIVVDDGSTEPIQPLVEQFGWEYLRIDGPGGPGRARNRGAALGSGRYLVFVDSDVCVHRDALALFAAAFASEENIAAVVGSYDDAPAEANFLSQYKNLFHHYVHQSFDGPIQTFWSGCGAMRRDLFLAFGGFDEERYRRPAIEDIELGVWVSAAGHRIVLDSRIKGQHLKRWTLGKLIQTDIFSRGVPWTRLMLRAGAMANTLNVTTKQRVSVALTGLALLGGLAALWWPPFLFGVAVLILSLTLLNLDFYRFFAARSGVWFALRVAPLHWLYFCYCGFSVVLGTLLHYLDRDSKPAPAVAPRSPTAMIDAGFRSPGPQGIEESQPGADSDRNFAASRVSTQEERSLSIVIAVVSGHSAVRNCLVAIMAQTDVGPTEIIVPYDQWSAEVGSLAQEFPQVRFHYQDLGGTSLASEASISAHAHRLYDRRRAVGLSLANGRLIAMTEDHAVPAADWLQQIHAAHAQPHAVIGGVIDNAIDRPLNWALYYCDFGRYGSPLNGSETEYVSDVNVSYKRAALESIRDVWREAYHETTVHWTLRSRGETLWLDPRLVVYQHRPAITLRRAYRERIEWGRVFAETRVAAVSSWRRLLYCASAPALPVLLLFRAWRQMRRQRRTLKQMIKTVPLVFGLLTGWALGELIGYASGSPRQAADPDLRELARRT